MFGKSTKLFSKSYWRLDLNNRLPSNLSTPTYCSSKCIWPIKLFFCPCVYPQLIQLLSYRRQRTLYFKGHLGLENWFITDLCSWRFWLNFRQSLQLPHAWNNSFQMLLDIWCYGLESVAYLKYKEILLCIPLLGWFTRISNFLMIAYSMLGRDHLELRVPITSCKSKLSNVHFGISSRSQLGSLFMLSLHCTMVHRPTFER